MSLLSPREFAVLIELIFIFFSSLLLIYSASRYLQRRIKSLLYFTVGFACLTLSMTLLLLDSLVWFPATITMLRLIEIAGLGLYMCFTIMAILALRESMKLD